MLLHTSKERAIFCYKKDKERLNRCIKYLIPLIKDYQENKTNYTEYIYDREINDYIRNPKLDELNFWLKEFDFKFSVVGYKKKIANIYKAKDYDDIIDYLEYLLERDEEV